MEKPKPTSVEAEIRRRSFELKIGGRTAKEILGELTAKGMRVSVYAKEMILSPAFHTQPREETIRVARVSLWELGLMGYLTAGQLPRFVRSMGYLDLCPGEAGPYARLADADQPQGDWYHIAMNPIPDSLERPEMFWLGSENGLWLYHEPVFRSHMWFARDDLLFRVR